MSRMDGFWDFINPDRFLDMFRDNEQFIMTKGLRIIALACLCIVIFFAIVAYKQFQSF